MRFRLGPLVVAIQVVFLALVGAAIVLISYTTSRDQLSAAIQQDFSRAARAAASVLHNHLELAATATDLLTREEAFHNALTREDWEEAVNALYEAGVGAGNEEIDILLLVDMQGNLLGNAGNLVDDEQALAESYRPWLQFEDWAIVGKQRKYLIRSLALIRDDGRIGGWLLYGLSLSENIQLMREFQEVSGVDRIFLEADGSFQAALPFENAEELAEREQKFANRNSAELFELDGNTGYIASLLPESPDSVRLILLHNGSAFASLAEAYSRNLWLLAALVPALGLITLLALRWLVIRPAGRLAGYALAARDQGADISWESGHIVEFEQAAASMQQVLKELQLTNRSLEDKVEERMRALQDSEQRTRTILETAADAIISMDEHGRILAANRAVADIFGCSPDGVLNRNVRALVSAPRRNGASTPAAILPDGNTILASQELQGIHASGRTFPLEVSISKTCLDGKPVYTAFIRDITDRKNVERELVSARLRAEAASDSKTMFLANMSHEIRTPMNAILGFLQLVLAKKELTEKTRSQLNTAFSAAENLLQIIDDILDLSKLESGKFELEKICFNLPRVIRDAVSTVESKAQEKRLELKISFDGDLPHCFTGDPTRLRQVLLNLLGNAIKFTDEGSVTVDVRRAAGSSMLQFAIKDTGIGIAKDKLDRIFESFTQADGSMTRQYGGTGLGTTISRQIVTLMDGEIWVESEPGAGSIFYFTASFEEPVCKEGCVRQARTEEAPEPRSPRKFNVLLVEDVPQNIELARLNLEEQGHNVAIAENGKIAVQSFQAGQFDIILMDVQMPVMDGKAAARAIRDIEASSGGHIPVLALTASVMKEEQEDCLRAGMDGVIPKPINFRELFLAMDKAVPQGNGRRGNQVSLQAGGEIHADLSPVADVIDLEQALGLWRRAETFRRSLLRFAEQRAEDGEQIVRALENGKIRLAGDLCHRLKGVAGNMAMRDLYDAIESLGDAMRAGIPEALAPRSRQVSLELDRVMDAISRLKTGDEAANDSDAGGAVVLALEKAALDQDLARQLLDQLADCLERSEVDDALQERLRTMLTGHVPASLLDDLRDQIESFDFDDAGQTLRQLHAECGKHNADTAGQKPARAQAGKCEP